MVQRSAGNNVVENHVFKLLAVGHFVEIGGYGHHLVFLQPLFFETLAISYQAFFHRIQSDETDFSFLVRRKQAEDFNRSVARSAP